MGRGCLLHVPCAGGHPLCGEPRAALQQQRELLLPGELPHAGGGFGGSRAGGVCPVGPFLGGSRGSARGSAVGWLGTEDSVTQKLRNKGWHSADGPGFWVVMVKMSISSTRACQREGGRQLLCASDGPLWRSVDVDGRLCFPTLLSFAAEQIYVSLTGCLLSASCPDAACGH